MNIQKIWGLLFGIYAAALPFGPAIPNILAGALLVFALYQIIRGKFILGLKEIRYFVFMNAFIIFLALTLFWSQNLHQGLSKLMLLFLIPLFFLAVLSGKEYISNAVLIRTIESFVISNCTLFISSFLVAISKNGISIDGLTENNLSAAFINFQYLGFSLYTASGLIFGCYAYIEHRDKISKGIRNIWPICLILLGTSIFLLSSRTTIVVVLSLVVLMIINSRKQISNKIIISTLAISLFGSILFININSVLREKIKDAVNYEGRYDVREYWGGRGFRELIWDCAWHQIKDHPLIGTGIGDQQDDMELCYRKHRYQQLLIKGNTFNAHNIFLQVVIASGLIGLILFILAFAYPIFYSIRNKHWLYLYFAFLILGTGMTESHFNRNAVVSLFAFFSPLILILTLNPKHENTSDT